MRHRFNRGIIASSDSFKVHSHNRMLQENHDYNHDYLDSINITIKVEIKKTPYIKVFGELVEITEEEAKIHSSINIYWL